MSLDIARIRALCFDVDGTLRDTDDQYVDQFARWLRPFHFLFANGDVRKLARRLVMTLEAPGTLLYSLPDRLGIDNHLATLVEWTYRTGLTRRPDVFWIVFNTYETLQTLSAYYPMAIISARSERSTMAFLAKFELLPFFQCIATAHTCPRTKPCPDPVLWAAKQMNVAPQECLVIGDTTVDIRAGKSAGAQTVGVLSGFGREKELRNAGADLILPSAADLPGVLIGRSATNVQACHAPWVQPAPQQSEPRV